MMTTPPTPGPAHRRRHWRRGLTALLVPLAALGLWVAYLLGTDNFHPIIKGEAYRSGQMSSNELAHCLEQNGIRSVVNLRGENPKMPWYREEVEIVQALGRVHRSFRMSSKDSVTPEQAEELLAILRAVPKPVLIHCDGGADRSAFAAALYAAKIAHWPPEKAGEQFSIWYGHLPYFFWAKKARLSESFRAYAHDGRPVPPRAPAEPSARLHE